MAPLRDVAAWAAYLPPESATARSMDAHWQRTPEVDLLREVEYGVRVLAWQKTADGSKGRNVPERLALPWDESAHDRPDSYAWGDLPESLADPRLLTAMGAV